MGKEATTSDDSLALSIWQAVEWKMFASKTLLEENSRTNLRKEKHLLDGASPNVPTRQAIRTFEPDCVLFHLSIDRVRQMNDEHFAFEIDFRYFGPPEVLDSFADSERTDA